MTGKIMHVPYKAAKILQNALLSADFQNLIIVVAQILLPADEDIQNICFNLKVARVVGFYNHSGLKCRTYRLVENGGCLFRLHPINGMANTIVSESSL